MSTVSRPALPHPPTVPGLLEHVAARWPDAEMVVTETDRLTYLQADVASRQLAKRLLAAGVGKGTRVGTHFPYGIEWVVSWLAVTRVGALHMPFSTAYKPAELGKALRHGDVHLLIAPRILFGQNHQGFCEEALGGLTTGVNRNLHLPALPYLREVWFAGGTDRGWATGVDIPSAAPDEKGVTDELFDALTGEVSPADPAITIFTSGTTSEPKAVTHSHGALLRKGAHLAALLGWDAGDKVFCGMPFFWVGGVAMTVVPAVQVGATLLCLDRTDPLRSLDLMEREQANRMTGWPGVRGPIEAHPTRPGRHIPALDQPATGFGKQGSIGMTETLASYTFPDDGRQVPDGRTGCMGVPIDGCDIRIVDTETLDPVPEGQEGAIHVRGYFLMQGICKQEREETFTPDGYYDTGDKGYLLDGMLYFTGRHKEMIKTSGNNVAPPEVEAVLRSIPGVKEAHVLGVPDEARGEIVAALVVELPGTSLDPDEIRELARRDLSNYKVPRFVVTVTDDDLPWLATGKPDRQSIRRVLIERRPSATSLQQSGP